jgi:glutathione S-transferase
MTTPTLRQWALAEARRVAADHGCTLAEAAYCVRPRVTLADYLAAVGPRLSARAARSLLATGASVADIIATARLVSASDDELDALRRILERIADRKPGYRLRRPHRLPRLPY